MRLPDPEPMDDETLTVRAAEEMCEDAAFYDDCDRRIPELEYLPELIDADNHQHEYHMWCDWRQELDEMDGQALARDLAECEEYPDTAPWVEDEHGHAVRAGDN